MVTRWTFDDPVALDSFTFEINPQDGGDYTRTKKINAKNTLGANAEVLVFESNRDVHNFDFSGVILTNTMYDALVDWFGRRNEIVITDDFGTARTVYITESTCKREWKAGSAQYATFAVKSILLEFV